MLKGMVVVLLSNEKPLTFLSCLVSHYERTADIFEDSRGSVMTMASNSLRALNLLGTADDGWFNADIPLQNGHGFYCRSWSLYERIKNSKLHQELLVNLLPRSIEITALLPFWTTCFVHFGLP